MINLVTSPMLFTRTSAAWLVGWFISYCYLILM